MPKSNTIENSSSNSESHSKKWFSKISLIPKKLKSGKSSSSLSNAIHHSKKSNSLEIVPLTKYNTKNTNTSVSNQTIYESSIENISIASNNALNKDSVSTQSSQITINTTIKNENIPIVSITSIPLDQDTNTKNQNVDINKSNPSYNYLSINSNKEKELRPNSLGHRTPSEHINTPKQRPRSYSDTPVISSKSLLYSDDDDNKSYEATRNLNPNQMAPIIQENYLQEKDLDLYDIKTPVLMSQNHTPVDNSSFSTPSNTIHEKISVPSASMTATPVLRHDSNKFKSSNGTANANIENKYISSPDHKLMSLIESMQQKSCDNMTAKEFALAVGINICDDDDSSDEEDEKDDKNSVSTITSTLSQLTANGKVPTANEIYNALSVKSIGRQRRKQSVPVLNLEMFIPPSSKEGYKSPTSIHSYKNECNKGCIRTMGDLSHKSSNQKVEKRKATVVSNTSKSNESCSTYVNTVNSKISSSSYSISSYQSGNTTNYASDLPENDYDSCYSNSSYLQTASHNGNSPDINGKNNISTTFYSLPRVTFHSCCNKSSITASKSTNSIPNSNSGCYLSNYNSYNYNTYNSYNSYNTYNNSYRDMGVGSSVRRHSRVSSNISNHSHSSTNSNKKAPSSPISIVPSHSLPNLSIQSNASPSSSTKINNSDSHNMYINSKTIATSNLSTSPSQSNNSSMNFSTSWSNGLSDVDNLRFAAMPGMPTKTTTTTTTTTINKPVKPRSPTNENKVEVYTKGRFTITHETYSKKCSTSCHKFHVERN